LYHRFVLSHNLLLQIEVDEFQFKDRRLKVEDYTSQCSISSIQIDVCVLPVKNGEQ
jgi:hypothetical protein